MTRRRMTRALAGAILATGVALAGGTVLAAPAAAEGADAIALSWDGVAFDTFLSGALFPSPRVVPGDTEVETFIVRNDGPGPGILTAEIVAVELAGDTTDPFYDEFALEGAPVISYLGHETVILERDLAMGEQTEIAIDYGFPVDSTVGNHPVEGTVQVEFRVRLTLQGDVPETTPPPSPSPSPSPSPPPTPTPPPAGASTPIPSTGASVEGPLVIGLALSLLGWAVVAATRRRRKPATEAPGGSGPDPA